GRALLDTAWWKSPTASLGFRASLLSLACYFGTQLASALRFPHIDTAILFPAYAFLTAALLLAPTRDWWFYLPAASIGTIASHLQGAPTTFVFGTEVANLIRALAAAGGLRYLIGARPRFETLRSVCAFLAVAVLLAPALAAIAGAGVVILHKGPGHDF